jgi:hypothetical protein
MEVIGQLHDPAALPSGKIGSDTHWIGDWVSPRAGLDAVKRRNIPAPAGNRTPVVQPIV